MSIHLYWQYRTMVENHQKDIPKLMQLIRSALERSKNVAPTIVIFTTAGRIHSTPHDHVMDECVYKFNRILAREAHKYGFPVFEVSNIIFILIYI